MKLAMMLIAWCLAASSAMADTIRVPLDEPTIQSAIDVARNGDEVLVAAGIYFEQIDLLGKSIAVRSESGAADTIIDGNGAGPVVRCTQGESNGTVLEGFTIRNAQVDGNGAGILIVDSSPSVVRCELADLTALDDGGGGIFVERGSPRIVGCRFIGCAALDSGGAICAFEAQPVIAHCEFSSNYAGFYGGAIYSGHGSRTVVRRCTFESNLSDADGGGLYCDAGRMLLLDSVFSENRAACFGGGVTQSALGGRSRLEMLRCTLDGNTAWLYGGGVFLHRNTNATVISTMLIHNEAEDAGGGLLTFADATLLNCASVGNTSGGLAGEGIDARLTLLNCTTIANDFGIQSIAGAEVVVRNSISWENEEGGIVGGADVAYSCIEGGYAGDGNVDQNPQLRDIANGDVRLSATSPCIDAGTNAWVPLDDLDFDGDCLTDDWFPSDLFAGRRRQDDPSTFDTGAGISPIVDMGAHEFGLETAGFGCSLDLNDDCRIDSLDLVRFFKLWAASDEAADFNGDGVVSTDDVDALLAAWEIGCL